ncbi:MAG: PIN domain-containing protein [Verrucomicrobiales bacterium]|nr:PIN domain-containing protein [Verrucomicrobiales bacterium]
MRYLLDVNLLVAWGWADHAEHARAAAWIAQAKGRRGTLLLTSAIPQLGFVRVSVQRTGGQVTPADAGTTLAGMLTSLGSAHQFLPDDQLATGWPEWCRSASQTTDAHLLALAKAHQAELATLDTGIPSAFVVPRLVGRV